MTNFPEAFSGEWEEEHKVQAQLSAEEQAEADARFDEEAEQSRLWVQGM